MQDCKTASTPLEQNFKLSCGSDTSEVNGTLYRQMVGSLNYLTTIRPDISYSVSILSQFMANPLEVHQNATKRVLRYLQGSISFGIEYTNHLNVELTGYSNSDWAGDLDNCKSTTSYAFTIGSSVVKSLSSIEAKYKALCSATCEAIWLRRILEDTRQKQEGPTLIKCDN